MNREFLEAVSMLAKERGIDANQLFDAIEEALVSAYRREFEIKTADNIRAEIDRESGEMGVFLMKEVVEEVLDPNTEISLLEAKEMDESFELGDLLELGVSPQDFGRLAAQTAKSVINQKLIGAERDRIQQEFSRKIGEIISGEVQRKERRDVYVDIERAEAILPRGEQVRTDRYEQHERMMFYVMKVDDRHGRPQVLLSRSHPALVQKLFEQEVPEIKEGLVEIVHVAREAGSRTKMSVRSLDENIDPLGSCVGQRGIRVKAVMDELHGEKIDIIQWDEDPVVYIMNALSPAKVLQVELSEEENEYHARVVVPDHQLSLAIGREGQNARLAARLTGWKIDIKSFSALQEEDAQGFMEQFAKTAEGFALEEGDAKQSDETQENATEDAAQSAEVERAETVETNTDSADSAGSADSATEVFDSFKAAFDSAAEALEKNDESEAKD